MKTRNLMSTCRSTPRELAGIDLAKFVCSILICLLHTLQCCGLEQVILISYLRLCVPLYFVFSSYFLFFKLNVLESEIVEKETLKKYCFRIAILYFVYVIIFSPFIIKLHFNNLNLITFLRFFYNLFFGSIYPSFWFLPALIWSVLFVYYISKKMSNGGLFLIAIIIYILLCLDTSYNGYLAPNGFFNFFIKKMIPGSFPLTFFSGIPWVIIGRFLAVDNPLSKVSNLKIKLILFFSILLLTFETIFFTKGAVIHTLIMLVPAAFFIFEFLKRVKVCLPSIKLMRHYSTIIYMLHMVILWRVAVRLLAPYRLEISPVGYCILAWGLTVFFCLVISWLFVKLSEYRLLRFLKYTY